MTVWSLNCSECWADDDKKRKMLTTDEDAMTRNQRQGTATHSLVRSVRVDINHIGGAANIIILAETRHPECSKTPLGYFKVLFLGLIIGAKKSNLFCSKPFVISRGHNFVLFMFYTLIL